MNPEPNFLNLPASPLDLNAQTQNIVPTKQTSNQLPSIQFDLQFDLSSGWIGIFGDDDNNIVTQTITDKGYYQFEIDGNIFSSDRTSSSFWQGLDGAIDENVVGINFDGGLGNDTLIVGSQNHHKSFSIRSDNTIQIQGEIQTESLSIKAQHILNQGIITANSVTAEFSNSYTDTAKAQIVAGNILLNGNTGNLQAQGQFSATGTTGGKIDLRAQTISLKGANLDASGENGGGTILIGGDYQGINSGNLTNARSTFVDRYSTIKANANQTGNGGKVIIWADGDTDFRGAIDARGGEVAAGDGGFTEISGKQNLNFVGKVDVDAPNGDRGSILLDPTDIIINADDGDEDTFDISDLYKIKGNINLSASNSIVFNTDAYFDKPQDTITLQAGGAVSLYGYFITGGGNLNISSQDIFLQSFLGTTPSNNKNSGSINLVSKGNITSQSSISSRSYFGDSGNIKIEAGGKVNIQNVGAENLQGKPGSISIKAGGEVKANSIETQIYVSLRNKDGIFYAGSEKAGSIGIVSDSNVTIKGDLRSSTSSSNGGNVSVAARGDINIQSGSIYTGTANGNAGSITLDASADILTNYISAISSEVGNGGTIKLTSKNGKIDTSGQAINTYATNGNAGSITLNAFRDITGGAINVYSNSMDAGSIQVTSKEGNIDFGQNALVANSDMGKGGNITLIANSQENNRSITTGFLNTLTNSNGNAGDVKLVASGDILTSSIYTFSRGDGNCGNISLETTNGSIDTTNAGFLITSTNGNGNAGNVKLLAKGNILATLVNAYTTGSGNGGNVTFKSISGSISTKNPSLDPATGQINTYTNTGNAGNIELEASGDIETGAITSNVLAGAGKGGDISLTGNNIIAESLRADSIGAEGGEIKLYASKFIQVTGSTLINGNEYSIFTDSKDVTPTTDDTGARSAAIWIRHSFGVINETLTPFIVGDSSKNGTANSISDGIVDFGVSAGSREIYDSKFEFNDIQIIRPLALIASIGGTPFTPDSILGAITQLLPYLPVLNVTNIQTIGTLVTNFTSKLTRGEILSLGLGINAADLNKYYLYLMAAMAIQGISSNDEQAHFISQLIHESARFNKSKELFDAGTEPSNPLDIGRGLIQITFESAYTAFGESLRLGNTFVKRPDFVSSIPIFSVLASTWYWTSDYESNKIYGFNWTQAIPATNPIQYIRLDSFKGIATDYSTPNNVVSDIKGDESDRVERITRIVNTRFYYGLEDRKLIFSKIRPAIGN